MRPSKAPESRMARIGTVQGGKATLIFDGQTTASKKLYACNSSLTFKPGDRVKITKLCGTYIVEYRI